MSILIQPQIPFVSPGAVPASCHCVACPTQGPGCPAGEPDRAAETGGQTYKPVFNWNPTSEYNTSVHTVQRKATCSHAYCEL